MNTKITNFFILGCLLWLLSPAVYSDLYSAPGTIERLRIHSIGVYFGTTIQPVGTCSNWGEYFTFDHKTEDGKAFLGMLLTAKASSKDIVIWYKESTAPGTDQTNGCDQLSTAVITGVGLP